MTAPHPENAPEPSTIRSRVPRAAAGRSLLDYLAERFRYLDRSQWRQEITAGRLSLDGRLGETTTVVRAGSWLAWQRDRAEPVVNRAVRILHDDATMVVVDKPAHLPSHADGPFIANTLVHIVRSMLDTPTIDLVHRLDRETSGVCVLARTAATRDALRRQFAAEGVRKEYFALVRGVLHDDVEVGLPIGFHAASVVSLRRSAAPDARGAKPAITRIEVLGQAADRTLVRCLPRTGRTHQIRAHLEALGTPVLGDKLYGRADADYLGFVARVKAGAMATDVGPGEPARQLLHAAAIEFEHPESRARVRFTSPLPDDFCSWLGEIPPPR